MQDKPYTALITVPERERRERRGQEQATESLNFAKP